MVKKPFSDKIGPVIKKRPSLNLTVQKEIASLDLPFKGYLLTFLAVDLFLILLVILLKRFLPPQIPLFYGLAEGEEQLAASWMLIMPSIAALIITLINSTLAYFFKDPFLKKVFMFGAFGLSVFSWITTVKIFFLVGSL